MFVTIYIYVFPKNFAPLMLKFWLLHLYLIVSPFRKCLSVIVHYIEWSMCVLNMWMYLKENTDVQCSSADVICLCIHHEGMRGIAFPRLCMRVCVCVCVRVQYDI